MPDLSRLLRPGSIAVVGGGAWGVNVVSQCRKIGFEGEIWPVHPKQSEIGGLPAVKSVEDLPEAPDAAFVAVNRDASIEVVAALARKGCGGAVCFASGFRETEADAGDGTDRQAALLAAAGEMRLLGPNCYGLLNYLDGVALWPDQHGGTRCDSGVAIICQSSNIAINLTMQRRGLPIAYIVTVGNQAQTGLSEIGAELLKDERVTALGLYIEGIDDLRDFEALAATARQLGKPIVALKIGRTEAARSATVSHTAALAGSAAGASALFERLGIGQVASLTGLLEALKLLHITGPLPSHRIASMSCSGGEAALIADAAAGTSLQFPTLTPSQTAELGQALGPRVALANPLDYHTYIWGDETALTQTFTAMMQADLGLGLVILDFPRADRCEAEAWEPVVRAVARTMATTGRKMAILASLPETMPEAVSQRLMAQGIAPLSGLSEAMEAIEIAAGLGQPRQPAAPLLIPKPAMQSRTLSEAEAKTVLAAHGLAVPPGRLSHSAQEASDVAADIGFPVVLKGTGIAHKTEAGAVALNLGSADEVRAAAESMASEGYLVEAMIGGGLAELLIGVVRDPAHGYVLTLAAGGVLTELLTDSASLLVPASEADVRDALGRLKIAKLLNGYRGAPAADKTAIVDAVMAVQAYVQAAKPMEIEINPLICGAGFAVAADALIRIGDEDD